MTSLLLRVWLIAALLFSPSAVTQVPGFDYFEANRQMIRNGVQAVLMCNGLFTSNRTLQQVFLQELAYLKPAPLGNIEGGPYKVEPDLQYVTVGGGEHGPAITAAYRKGLACVVMAPGTGSANIAALPQLDLPPVPGDAAIIPWPDGDLLQGPEPGSRLLLDAHGIDANALQAASDWAFDRPTAEQDSLSLLVVHRGKIVLERYAEGVDMHTRTRTWSAAKSIAVTLIGILADQGRMALDKPLGIEWLPEIISPATDPRNAITLRHVLNMSSGLYPVDSFGMEYATGSGLAYWAGASSVDGMRDRGMVRQPGTFWDYENYDTLLAVYAMKHALVSEQAYLEFPRKALFDRIGMRNTLASTDRFGNFILSSQVYTNARDLARFGLLYLNRGEWNGGRLLSEAWVDFVRTPAPASAVHGSDYGGQWWLVPSDREDVPADAYAAAGNRGQYVIVVPSHELVIVRRGLDHGAQGYSEWDLLREILRAIPASPPG